MTRTGLAATLDTEMRRHVIAKAITCPITGAVIDIRTAVIVRDADGDPRLALSPEGWAELQEKAQQTGLPALAEGYHVEED